MSSSNWTGTYNDPIYGGNIYVCVSDIDGVLYGQGGFSEVGYMRGIISDTDLWIGEFYTCGLEVKQGNFSLQLNSMTFDVEGTFYERPGITYNMSTSKISDATPSDLKCMKTDDEFLTLSASSTYYTGLWLGPENYGYSQYQYDTGSTAMFSIGDAFGWHPISYLNNQVSPGQWYTNTTNGIEIFVLKNATSFYLTWWGVQRVADFEYETMVHNPALHVMEYMNMESISTNITETEASAAYCQMLPTQYTLNACLNADVTVNTSSDDDSMSVGRDDVIGLSFGAAVALLLAYALGYYMASRQRKPTSEIQKPLRESELGNSYLS